MSFGEQDWTRSKVLAISDQKAKALGYDIEGMSVSFDVHNSEWRNYLKSLTGIGGLPKVEEKLAGHEFWAVYYSSLERNLLVNQ